MEAFVSQGGLIISYILFGIAVVGVVVLPLIKAFDNPQKIVKGLIALGLLGVVFLISWGISGAETTEMYTEKGVGESLSKVIGGVLIMMYLLAGIAIVGIVYSEFHKAVK
ncbi:MAG: hypothetical protein OEW67_09285 [Cyclobacteriaceae bacterium]|nr:hypothetical protein [Cyclobacteriaceae bacterium]